MKSGELARLRFTFGSLGVVPVFLAGWLGWVQVAEAGELSRAGRSPLRLLPSTADGQSQRVEVLPAPRGTIVDRHGSVLALDCETYEVRANISVPADHRKTVTQFRDWLKRFLADVSLALVADPDLADRADSQRFHVERLGKQLANSFALDRLPDSGPLPPRHPARADVLLASGVDSLAVVDALRALGERRSYRTVGMHFLRSFRREYPDREVTHGVIGHLNTAWIKPPAGGNAELVTKAAAGLESMSLLAPGEGSARSFLRDGTGRPYFTGPADNLPKAQVVHSTLDVDLQRIAVRELASQAEASMRDGKTKNPQWGALVLVDIETGDVLAAAGWQRDAKNPAVGANPAAVSFAPSQQLFEPGSIVKPLVLAYAYEAGCFDWASTFDCAPGSSEYRERIAKLGRAKPVRDDHDCGVLSPHGILMNSSNIGAAYVGLMLEREQWRDYMSFYGLDGPLGLELPSEGRAGTNRKSFDPSVPLRSFRANSAISFSFGYEMQVTALHVARAYLRMFRGGGSQLRLCRGIESDGVFHPAPVAEPGAKLRPEVVDAVRAAMVDVVSDDPHATGVHLHTRMLKELGIDLHGVIAGKTGTASSRIGLGGGRVLTAKNASFVGFAPVDAPRWLAVCVLQKDDSARFYGGSYAAPPAVRLLLQCQQLEHRRQLRQESPSAADGQVRSGNTPGDSGWDGKSQGQSR